MYVYVYVYDACWLFYTVLCNFVCCFSTINRDGDHCSTLINKQINTKMKS